MIFRGTLNLDLVCSLTANRVCLKVADAYCSLLKLLDWTERVSLPSGSNVGRSKVFGPPRPNAGRQNAFVCISWDGKKVLLPSRPNAGRWSSGHQDQMCSTVKYHPTSSQPKAVMRYIYEKGYRAITTCHSSHSHFCHVVNISFIICVSVHI